MCLCGGWLGDLLLLKPFFCSPYHTDPADKKSNRFCFVVQNTQEVKVERQMSIQCCVMMFLSRVYVDWLGSAMDSALAFGAKGCVSPRAANMVRALFESPIQVDFFFSRGDGDAKEAVGRFFFSRGDGDAKEAVGRFFFSRGDGDS